MRKNPPLHLPPATILVWTLNDRVLESPDVLRGQFEEIRNSGFEGVAPWVRCSRYSWTDPLAIAAMRAIAKLSAGSGLEFWIGADPRFVSRELIAGGNGLELILFGDSPRASIFPHLVPVDGDRYSIRCSLAPRHVHTLTEVAVEYHPLALAGVYAIPGGGPAPAQRDVLNLTTGARMFFNARENYVEAFGRDPRLAKGTWQVLAFFHVRTNHVDFSDREQMEKYLHLLGRLRKEGVAPHGVMWDEPGFTCTYGTLPFTPAIRRGYARRAGRPVEKDLWKLAVDARDGSHAPVRVAYYREIQQGIAVPNRRMTRRIAALWGPGTISGIHDTWHFESGDMCDMNHGSLDLWEGMKVKSGGFVDLGGIDKLRDPESPWYDNLAAMTVAAASLGRASQRGFACNNLWTVGDDDGAGWQAAIMSHCVDTMAAFGTRWLAHAYGPVGTIGEEASFLGSPPLPGYPNHSTWPHFPQWNRRLSHHLRLTEDRLPHANLLVLFPVDALYALADTRADAAAGRIFRLLRILLDHHYHPALLSPALCSSGRWTKDGFVSGKVRYDAVIAPFPTKELAKHAAFRGSAGRALFTLESTFPFRGVKQCEDDTTLLHSLAAIPELRPVEAPETSWVTLTQVHDGILLALLPSRQGFSYSGKVTFADSTIELPVRKGLCAIHIPAGRKPRILTAHSTEE